MLILETVSKYSVFSDLKDFTIKTLVNKKTVLPDVRHN